MIRGRGERRVEKLLGWLKVELAEHEVRDPPGLQPLQLGGRGTSSAQPGIMKL